MLSEVGFKENEKGRKRIRKMYREEWFIVGFFERVLLVMLIILFDEY